jgi:predicted DNA-binding ribbon-helix-helix protein
VKGFDPGMKLNRRPRRNRTIKSLIGKQSVSINGHHSSVSLEGAFWNALKEIAVGQNISINALISKIDSARDAVNLSSAIRVYVVEHYRSHFRSDPDDPARPRRRGDRIASTQMRLLVTALKELFWLSCLMWASFL